MQGINIENHYSIQSSNEVQQLCDGLLNSIGITYFNYIKIYNEDCSRELLTNNSDWIAHFYREGLYNSAGAIDVEHLLPKGYFLWSEMDEKDPSYLHGKEYYNIDNGISFVIKRKDVTYLYIFASCRENKLINNFYVSNIDLLQRFIHYFNDSGRELINKAAESRIYLPGKQLVNNKKVNNIGVSSDTRNSFYKKTKVKRYYLLNESDDLYLTQKQADSIKLSLKGLSAKEIANAMNISHRTVESYMFEVKEKLQDKIGGSISKEELIKIMRQANIV